MNNKEVQNYMINMLYYYKLKFKRRKLKINQHKRNKNYKTVIMKKLNFKLKLNNYKINQINFKIIKNYN